MNLGKQKKVITVVPVSRPRAIPIRAPGWPKPEAVPVPIWPVRAPAEVERA